MSIARKRALLVHFSLARSTAKVAQALVERLSDHFFVDFAEIVPARHHGYKYWLFLSFFPNVGVAIKPVETNLEKFDLVVLGTPKWTFNCPPVTEYLKLLRGTENKHVALYVVHKGFGERRYSESLKRRLQRIGMNVIATATFPASSVWSGTYKSVFESFVDEIIRSTRN